MTRGMIFILLVACSQSALSDSTPKEVSFDTVRKGPTWSSFDLVMREQENKDYTDGLSYIISGGIAIAGGLYGYYSSEDLFAKAVYSIAQTAGIAAIGYGAFKLTLGDDHRVFYQTVRDTRSLTPQQRDEMVRTYFNLEKQRERSTRTIKAITHGLVALLNAYNALTATNQDLRTALFFVGGVNALASISFVF